MTLIGTSPMPAGRRRRHDRRRGTSATAPACGAAPTGSPAASAPGSPSTSVSTPSSCGSPPSCSPSPPGSGWRPTWSAWWLLPLDRRPRPTPAPEPSPWLAALQRDDPRTIIGAGCLGIGAVVLLRSAGLLADSVVTVAATLVAAGIAVAWVRTSPEDRDRLLDAAARAPGSPRALLRGGPGSVARLALGSVLVLGGAFAVLAAADAVDDAGIDPPRRGGHRRRAGAAARPVDRRSPARGRARSAGRASAPRSGPTSPPSSTTRCCRPSPSSSAARRPGRPRPWRSPAARSASCGRGCTATAAPCARPATPPPSPTALEAVAAEVEADHGVEVEVVAVGDHPLDDRHRRPRRRGPGGARQRRPPRRGAVGRPLRRGRRRHRHGVRARPRPRASTPPPPCPTTATASPSRSRGAWRAPAAGRRSRRRRARAPRWRSRSR